jgi:hypothetical protein
MRAHYEFAKMKGRRNPYAKLLKQAVTMRLDRDTVAYFKTMAGETGLPYQTLINLYLRDCAAQGRRLSTEWVRGRVSEARAKYRVGNRRMPRRMTRVKPKK